MKRLAGNPNVIQIYGVTFNANRPILVVELGNETLYNYLWERHTAGATASWLEKNKLCFDVLKGIQGLHAAGIIHGDLKGANILIYMTVEKFPIAKITDFGYSSTLSYSTS